MSVYIKLQPEISSGSFGTTYYAKTMDDEKLYVIKEMNLAKVNLAQIYIELDSLLMVKATNCRKDILCFKDYYVDYEAQTFNLITEAFIEDDVFPLTLRQFLNIANIRSNNEIIKIIHNISKAMAYIHEIDIGHGDIKPENILINKNLDIQIIDFGLSCTRECVVGGTLIYESPEMLNKTYNKKRVVSKDFQKRSDIFSLGLVFYELANASLPFKKIKNWSKLTNNQRVVELLKLYNRERLLSKNEDIEINYVINEMLNINPLDRPNLNEVFEYIDENFKDEIMTDYKSETSPMDIYMKTLKYTESLSK